MVLKHTHTETRPHVTVVSTCSHLISGEVLQLETNVTHTHTPHTDSWMWDFVLVQLRPIWDQLWMRCAYTHTQTHEMHSVINSNWPLHQHNLLFSSLACVTYPHVISLQSSSSPFRTSSAFCHPLNTLTSLLPPPVQPFLCSSYSPSVKCFFT